jgi:hypothetical protein
MNDIAISILSGSVMICLTLGTFGWLIHEKLFMIWRVWEEHDVWERGEVERTRRVK